MCWFLRRGENWSTWRKTSRSKNENQQQTQPTYMYDTRDRESYRGHISGRCALSPLPSMFYLVNKNLSLNMLRIIVRRKWDLLKLMMSPLICMIKFHWNHKIHCAVFNCRVFSLSWSLLLPVHRQCNSNNVSFQCFLVVCIQHWYMGITDLQYESSECSQKIMTLNTHF